MTGDNIDANVPIPLGLTGESLRVALAAIASAIGPEKLNTDDLADFQDPFQFSGSAVNVPSGVVSPTSVEDVQAIMRIANEHGVPLWPLGRGKNNGYGGAAPQVRGALML